MEISIRIWEDTILEKQVQGDEGACNWKVILPNFEISYSRYLAFGFSYVRGAIVTQEVKIYLVF
jgi:hypothetical protein